MLNSKGQNCIIILDGLTYGLYDITGRENDYTTEERIAEYIEEKYWYLPYMTRKRLPVLHGFSMVMIVNNFVFFESLTPNKNYMKQIEIVREMFPTSILINNNDSFMCENLDDLNFNPLVDNYDNRNR